MKRFTESTIRNAVGLKKFDPSEAWKRLTPDPALPIRYSLSHPQERTAAVAIILFESSGEYKLILTQRSNHLKSHAGQISFPGGAVDPNDESFQRAAMRESCEEINLCSHENIEYVGDLTEIFVPVSRFRIHPSVFLLKSEPKLTPAESEVEKIFFISLESLFGPGTLSVTTRKMSNNQERSVPCYRVDSLEIWGATAILLSELQMRLNYVSPIPDPDKENT